MTGDVELRINSPGGDVFGAKAMAQAMREYDGQVTAHVDGIAASARAHLPDRRRQRR
jgi:ATP-dependent Clp protease protease subunit